MGSNLCFGEDDFRFFLPAEEDNLLGPSAASTSMSRFLSAAAVAATSPPDVVSKPSIWSCAAVLQGHDYLVHKIVY